MVKPKVALLKGLGINCEDETAHAFRIAGAEPELIHVNELIAGNVKLDDYQILAFPGGFSYGDDTGAGNALANRIRNHLWDEIRDFVEADNLAIGICNGFQVMANLGLLPALDGKYGTRKVALVDNKRPRYLDRWVDLKLEGESIWTRGINRLCVPIAHGEGKFYTDPDTLVQLNRRGLIAARYVKGYICNHQEKFQRSRIIGQ